MMSPTSVVCAISNIPMPFRRAVAVGCFVPLPVCFGKLALLFAYELILYTLLSSSSMHSMEVVCIICILRRSYLVVCILESTILLLARVCCIRRS